MRAAVELLALVGLAGLAAAALGFAPAGQAFALAVMLVYAAVVAVALRRSALLALPLGWPNRVTVLRGLLGAILLGSLLSPGRAAVVAGVAVLAIGLDAVDGWLARRLGASTGFGARLDMETDAALMLVLCLVLMAQGRGGAWLPIVGLARYAFVAAGAVVPALRAPLHPSERRRVAAAAVMIALAVATIPAVPAAGALAITTAATLATVLSFAVDIAWLLRRGARA
ncbi:MAG: CDP-alcohol phosphatidyltransferase family protein [Alphaproteobacteria bacterium]|nr:CDP-alcohol phosphatidyltransferase family protein [Alphaproteobacteria bacterium]